MIRKPFVLLVSAIFAFAGCNLAQPADVGRAGKPVEARLPRARSEPGYKIVLLSERIENPMFHSYATMAIDSMRFDQLENDFGKAKQVGAGQGSSDISLQEVVVEEYARFYSYYEKILRLAAYKPAGLRNRKPKKGAGKPVSHNESIPPGRGGIELEAVDPDPICRIDYNEADDKLTAKAAKTPFEKVIQEISDKIERGYVASTEVDKAAEISYNVEKMSLARAMLELCMAYERAAGKGLEIELENFSFSVRPGLLTLFRSVKLRESIKVDNVRLYLDLKDKSIFALVTYPGGGETSVYFVYRFPPGRVLALPESLSVFATRRKIKVKRTE